MMTGERRRSVNSWSSSESVTETVLGTHMFEIKGYSLTKGMGIGKCIASKKFTIGGYEWGIQFYPDGKYSKDNSSYVSLFITLYSNAIDVSTFYQIILLDQTPKRKRHAATHYDHSFECGPCVFKTRGSMWGYNRFCNRKDLEASGFLKDDCLKIECTIGVVVTSCSDSSKLKKIHVPDSGDMREHFGMLLDSRAYSDITFSVRGHKFHAHKLVLAARSKLFLTEFVNGREKDEHGHILVNDIEPRVFKALLHFIYRDSLIHDKELYKSRWSPYSSVSETFAAKLLAAAEKFDLSRLKLMCESVLCNDISTDTVVNILLLADRNHATELKFACLKFAVQNLHAVMQSDCFKYLTQENPLLQVELLKTWVECKEPFIGKRKYETLKTQSPDDDH
ncbi:BTB/POZ and MATH domain-containing protein 4-like [Vigna radiata var. radiata]|uniref:BTB/POZ and MATH domain-containing protein 4-like n=1 Tax=Vigna radiata var. radiata TaxID=3916 RepID=A0A1S3TBC0_VIGRR|nr:BTB/POZ and MATH domain-containing protein 4-like [Vigna radiata var. radiata]